MLLYANKLNSKWANLRSCDSMQ